MSRHICDCGAVYCSPGEVLACAGNNHGQPLLRPMGELEDYERWVEQVWSAGGAVDLRDLAIMNSGLGGETGEVQELLVRELATIAELSTSLGKEAGDVVERVKKHIRNHRQLGREEMTSELGDVLYHVVRIARWQGISMREIMTANRRKVNERIRDRRLTPRGQP